MIDFELREEVKATAIAHWKDNLKLAEKLNWKKWSKREYSVKRRLLDSVHYNGIPQIFGDVCPYCEVYGKKDNGCLNCPLYSGDDAYDEIEHIACCKAWVDIKRSILFSPEWADKHTKEELLEAMKSMIAKLESVDNTLPEGEFEIQGRLDHSKNLTRTSDDE